MKVAAWAAASRKAGAGMPRPTWPGGRGSGPAAASIGARTGGPPTARRAAFSRVKTNSFQTFFSFPLPAFPPLHPSTARAFPAMLANVVRRTARKVSELEMGTSKGRNSRAVCG